MTYLTEKEAWLRIAKTYRDKEFNVLTSGICHEIGWLEFCDKITEDTLDRMGSRIELNGEFYRPGGFFNFYDLTNYNEIRHDFCILMSEICEDEQCDI